LSFFVADVPETKYAKSGDIHIAYQAIGQGPTDLVAIPSMASNLEVTWEEPTFVRFFNRFSSFCRFIHFDKRGTGLSDRVPEVPTLEERMDDARAVMDTVGSERAALMGFSEGGPMAALFAATYPERTTALILCGSFARFTGTEDYPWMPTKEVFDQLIPVWAEQWGTSSTLSVPMFCPSKVGDEGFLRWFNHLERQSATPTSLKAILGWNTDIDIREILPAIQVPTLVLHRTGDLVCSIDNGRYLAEHIPNAKFVELVGADHFPNLGDSEAVVAEIEEFLTGVRSVPEPDRVLATVLFTDICASTERAAQLGDQTWKELLDCHDKIVRHQLDSHRGQWVNSTGDGLVARFDGPGRAIRCATSLRDALRGVGLEVRAGLHTGEIELRGEDIAGVGVHIAQRVQGMAKPSEVLASRTVVDLVTGSGIGFEDRGEHELKGVPGTWKLFAVAG
jgi:class 3 adenylate cyclase